MALKVKLEGEGDNKHVPPAVMDLLVRLAEHRDLCSECTNILRNGRGNYCATGAALVIELGKQEGVQFA